MENSTTLNQLAPSEILETSSLKTYEETLDLVWKELLRLRSYLFILDKLLHFPSDPSYLFLGPEQQTFLELAKISFTESSLLIITKLATDSKKDQLSMLRFKNWIRQHVKQEYQEAFDRLLRQSKFTKHMKASLRKAKKLRDGVIAHLLVDGNLRLRISTDAISIQEISHMADEIKRLFDVLCFGVQHSTLPLEYDPTVQHPVGADPRSDIEHFLDLIIQNSDLFKMPEESPYWNIYRENLSPEITRLLNEYRRKFGKPEV